MNIQEAIEILEEYAEEEPDADVAVVMGDQTFLVTKIGLGTCSCCDEQIVGMFFEKEEVVH